MSTLFYRLFPEEFKVSIGIQLRNIRLYIQERNAYRANRSKARNEHVKVMIFAQGRTGSTVLESLISSNKNFLPLHEVLSRANTAWKRQLTNPNLYLEGLSRMYPEKNIVCHVKIDHLVDQDIPPLEFFESLSADWKIIYLFRENLVLHALSTFIADARKTYHTTETNLKLNAIPVDLRFFQKLAKGRSKDREDEIEILSGKNRLEVKYEDGLIGLENQQMTVNRIAEFLEIESWEASTPLHKVNKTKLRDLISNYDDFMEVIKENSWEHFVEGL